MSPLNQHYTNKKGSPSGDAQIVVLYSNCEPCSHISLVLSVTLSVFQIDSLWKYVKFETLHGVLMIVYMVYRTHQVLNYHIRHLPPHQRNPDQTNANIHIVVAVVDPDTGRAV